LEQEYVDFLRKHEKVIVASFGTFFSHKNETIEVLLDALEKSFYGTILSLSEYDEIYSKEIIGRIENN